VLSELGALFATSLDAVPEAARLRLSELAQQASALRAAREALDEYRARELYTRAGERSDTGRGLVVSVEKLIAGSLQELRGIAQRYASLPRAVFVATLESPPSILLAASESSGIDAGALLKAALAASSGRGGGSPRLAQGTVSDAAALDAVLQALGSRLGPLSNDKPPKLD
jgi:alanyl-tRNA synthetase